MQRDLALDHLLDFKLITPFLPPYGSPMVTQLFGVNLRSDSTDPTAARHKRFPGQHAHEDLPKWRVV